MSSQNKPRISVLLPTRQRTALLHRMLETLVTTAEAPSTIEVALRIDDDDVETQAYLEHWSDKGLLGQLGGLSCAVGPTLRGYADVPTFVNDAARIALSDLMIVINDDVVFETPGWERLLVEAAAAYPDGFFDIGVNTVMNNPNFVFPCQSRRQIEALGFFYDARLIYPDIWLRDVLEAFGRAVHVPHITIRHDWVGQTESQLQAIRMRQSHVNYEALYAQCVEEGRRKVEAAMKETLCR